MICKGLSLSLYGLRMNQIPPLPGPTGFFELDGFTPMGRTAVLRWPRRIASRLKVMEGNISSMLGAVEGRARGRCGQQQIPPPGEPNKRNPVPSNP